MRKINYEDFVNDVDYEDENMDDYDGIVVVMVVVAVVVEETMSPTWRYLRNRTLSKTCRVCLDDNQQ